MCSLRQCRELLLGAMLAAALLWPQYSTAPPSQPVIPPQATACDLLIGAGGEDIALRRNICLLVAAGELAEMRWQNFSRWQPQARQFYDPVAYSAAWTDNGWPTPQARALIDLFEHAGKKGLQAEDYDGPRWLERMNKITGHSAVSASDLAAFDVALTISALRYLSDLHQGRVNPADVRFGLPVKTFDTAGFLRNQVLLSGDVKSAVGKLEPAYASYKRTLQALESYAELLRQGEDAPLPPIANILVPGKTYPGAWALAQKLRRLGDLAEDAQLPAQADLYAGELVVAVKNFQQRHGLKPDGRIGDETFQQLSTPLAVRVRQLELALERFRWLPSGL
ncbi:MAG TPA: peptidoglycan-binding protein, partial [Candidatus Angelobacter sp.]